MEGIRPGRGAIISGYYTATLDAREGNGGRDAQTDVRRVPDAPVSQDAGVDVSLDSTFDALSLSCPIRPTNTTCGGSTDSIRLVPNSGMALVFEPSGSYVEVLLTDTDIDPLLGPVARMTLLDADCNAFAHIQVQDSIPQNELFNGHSLNVSVRNIVVRPGGGSATITLNDGDSCDGGIVDAGTDADVTDASVDVPTGSDAGEVSADGSETCPACVPPLHTNDFGRCDTGSEGLVTGLCAGFIVGNEVLFYSSTFNRGSVQYSVIDDLASDSCVSRHNVRAELNTVWSLSPENISFVTTYPNPGSFPLTSTDILIEAWASNCATPLPLTLPAGCTGPAQTFTIPLLPVGIPGDSYHDVVYLGPFKFYISAIGETVGLVSGGTCSISATNAAVNFGLRTEPLTSVVLSQGMSASGSFGVGCMAIGVNQINVTVGAPDATTGICPVIREQAVLTVMISQ